VVELLLISMYIYPTFFVLPPIPLYAYKELIFSIHKMENESHFGAIEVVH